MEQREFAVEAEDAGQRIDRFLAGEDTGLSRSALQNLIAEGHVLANGQPAAKNRKLKAGDTILVEIPDAAPIAAVPQDIPLDIVYEDGHLLVVNKPKGMVVHPAPGNPDGTLVNALLWHCRGSLSGIGGEIRPGIVHRIDKDTSGLLVVAKDDATQKALQDLIRLRVLDRRYIALVHGPIAHDGGTIETGIARSTRDRIRMAVSDAPGAREAITTFRVLERYEAGRRDEGYTLVECHLYTGRTHQIRVHMRHVGHPLVGDPLYGRGDDRVNFGLSRQFLHSWRISFEHPVTGETVKLADSLPPDLLDVLESLDERSMGRTQAGEKICPRLRP